MKKKLLVAMCLIIGVAFMAQADVKDDYKKFLEKATSDFEKFRNNAIREYEDFRRKANEDFAKFMEQPWEPTDTTPEEKAPVMPSPKPVVIDIDTVKPLPPKPVVIAEVTPVPEPEPQPEPVEPIQEVIEETVVPQMTIRLYGTDFSLRQPDLSGFKLSGTSGADVSKAWKWLNHDRTNNLIRDCLDLREERALCDWAYLNFLHTLAEKITGGKKNEATLLTGFLFSQSGYKMRFGMDPEGHLHLFYNPTGIVYDKYCLLIDGARFYKFDNGLPSSNRFKICKFEFPGERSLTFEIRRPMKLDYSPGSPRQATAYSHPDVKVETTVNKNLIDFYNAYPKAALTEHYSTLWAMYGNAAASPEISDNIYPVLREAVRGKSQKDAANILIHLAETFPYGDDNEMWGGDRAFFMDESWHYPLSDCEDHAINFSRMIRDIMGLDVVLLLYPDHLATAVAFTDPEIDGDYIFYNNKKYTVCDPTIFFANIGMTMRGVDNSEAIIIPLR